MEFEKGLLSGGAEYAVSTSSGQVLHTALGRWNIGPEMRLSLFHTPSLLLLSVSFRPVPFPYLLM